jgi:uncharacterized membrane protein
MYMRGTGLLIVGIVLIFAFASTMWGGWNLNSMMGPGMMGSGMMGGWMSPWIWIFPITIAGGVFLLLTGSSWFGGRRHGEALAIAAERFARGEITSEEFEKIKERLSGS